MHLLRVSARLVQALKFVDVKAQAYSVNQRAFVDGIPSTLDNWE